MGRGLFGLGGAGCGPVAGVEEESCGCGSLGGIFADNGFLLLLLLFILLASGCFAGRKNNFFFIIILAIIAFGGFGRTFGLGFGGEL